MNSDLHGRSRGGDAQRWIWITVGAAITLVAGWMTLEGLRAYPPKASVSAASPPPATATEDAGAIAAADAGSTTSSDDLDAGLYLPTLSLGDASVTLPSSAPRSVKIGIVLVTFSGAEGAPSNARSKKDALALAEQLATTARSDFHRAVTSGDPGSADDVGRMPRGVLDPRTEVAVFGLSTGDVSEVLETPRGYWIVKRID